MKHITRSVLAATLCTAAVATAARADVSTTGPYIEAGVGLAHSNGDFARQVRDSLARSANYQYRSADYDRSGGGAGRVAIGWMLHSNLGIEAAFSEFGRFATLSTANVTSAPGTIAYREGHFRVSAATIDTIAQVAINPRLALHARLGVAAVEQKYGQRNFSSGSTDIASFTLPSNRQTRLHWGAGGRYVMTDRISATLNYTRIENVGHDFSSVPIQGGTRAGRFSYGLLGAALRYTF